MKIIDLNFPIKHIDQDRLLKLLYNILTKYLTDIRFNDLIDIDGFIMPEKHIKLDSHSLIKKLNFSDDIDNYLELNCGRNYRNISLHNKLLKSFFIENKSKIVSRLNIESFFHTLYNEGIQL